MLNPLKSFTNYTYYIKLSLVIYADFELLIVTIHSCSADIDTHTLRCKIRHRMTTILLITTFIKHKLNKILLHRPEAMQATWRFSYAIVCCEQRLIKPLVVEVHTAAHDIWKSTHNVEFVRVRATRTHTHTGILRTHYTWQKTWVCVGYIAKVVQ